MLAGLLLFAITAVSAFVEDQTPLSSRPYISTPPLLGFGTWNLDRSNATEAVSWAIQTGYRHIDCAAAYRNEDLVGKGIAEGLKKAGISREDIWVTSKLWNSEHDPERVPHALDTTLSDLGLSYLDLYHMHWPVSQPPSSSKPTIAYTATWRAMSDLLSTGKVRFIGVSNFSPAQLDTLLNETSIKPAVHQMELHPYLQQRDWVAYHADRGIHVTAYSPLGGTNPTYHGASRAEVGGSEGKDPTPLLENDAVAAIAEARGCSAAQVVLKWGVERGTSVIPKSSHKSRIEENWGAWGCELEMQDYAGVDRLGGVEKRYNNPSGSWGVGLYEGLEGV